MRSTLPIWLKEKRRMNEKRREDTLTLLCDSSGYYARTFVLMTADAYSSLITHVDADGLLPPPFLSSCSCVHGSTILPGYLRTHYFASDWNSESGITCTILTFSTFSQISSGLCLFLLFSLSSFAHSLLD